VTSAIVSSRSTQLLVGQSPDNPVVPERLDDLADLRTGWLLRFGPNTRAGYAHDFDEWARWCQTLGVHPLAAGIHHGDAYHRYLAETAHPRTGQPLAPSTIARRLSALSSFYRYALAQRAVTESSMPLVSRPKVSDESTSVGLDRDEMRRLLVAAQSDGPRSTALVTLLAVNGLRITEGLSRNVEHLRWDEGHRVLLLDRKGGKRAKAPLSAVTSRALDAYIGERTTGPVFVTANGRRMVRSAAWAIVRRLARKAGIASADYITPHSLRHAFGTAALDAGVPLRDVQDAMGHADPRTTRRYDRSRHSLDRHATYAVAAFLDDGH
jgi:integrase/recombinase XerD